MKTLVFYSILFLVGSTLADEIHKHDGSILKGKIIEIIPNELYKIQLAGGSILVIKPEEVKEIVISSAEATETPTPSIDISSRSHKRYHIGILAGFYKASPDNLKFLDYDLTNAVLAMFNFRYSLTPVVDLAIENRAWISSDRGTIQGLEFNIDVTSSFFGIGIRVNGKDEQVKPFFQGSIYFVLADIDIGNDILDISSGNGIGIGIGLSGGLDIKASELISIPVEIIYIGTDGDDIGNLSGFGLSVGVNFNF